MSEPVGNSPRGGSSPIPAIPSNSHKNRAEEPAAPPKMEKVIEGKVVMKKPSVWKRVSGSIVADDAKGVSDYLLEDVFIPALKNMLYNIIAGGADRALFGGRGGRPMAGGYGRQQGPVSTIIGGGLRTKYETMSEQRPQLTREDRSRHDFENLVLDSPEEARLAIESLIVRCQTYGSATVADLYDALGVTGSYADRNYGWTELDDRNSDYRQTRGGFVLQLPRPQLLR